MKYSSPHRLLLLSFTLVMLLAMAACAGSAAGSTPTSAPQATPTPTARPLASEPYLDLPEDATFGDIMERVPAGERECVRERMGDEAYAQVLEQPAFRPDGLDPLAQGIDPTCFSSDTLVGLLAAGIDHQAGGLSETSLSCIEGTFQGLDVSRLIQEGQEQEQSPEDARRMFGAIVALLLCLTDEEAARIEMGAPGGGEDFSLQDLRCILERVDPSVLMDFFTIAPDQNATPSPEALQRLAALMQAMNDCGVEFPEDMGPMP